MFQHASPVWFSFIALELPTCHTRYIHCMHYITSSGFFIIMSPVEGLHFSALVGSVSCNGTEDQLLDCLRVQYNCSTLISNSHVKHRKCPFGCYSSSQRSRDIRSTHWCIGSCSSGGCHWMDCVVCLLSEKNKQVSSIERTIFAIKE